MVGPVNVDLPSPELALPVWYKHFDRKLRSLDLADRDGQAKVQAENRMPTSHPFVSQTVQSSIAVKSCMCAQMYSCVKNQSHNL